jgi:hypothetical protein
MIERLPELIKIPTLGRREVSITNGGLKNGYISLSAMRDFFPRDAIGGSKYASAAPKLLTLIFEGRSFRSDIAGGKRWMIRKRSRSGMRGFFALTKAKAGDVVIVDTVADYVYAIRLKRGAST